MVVHSNQVNLFYVFRNKQNPLPLRNKILAIKIETPSLGSLPPQPKQNLWAALPSHQKFMIEKYSVVEWIYFDGMVFVSGHF